MPPLSTDPEEARRYFQRLRRLRDFFAGQVPQADWHELSMGTSADFAVAVEEGRDTGAGWTGYPGPKARYGG